MDEPERVRRMVRSARRHTPPLTAKIRLGETLDVARLRDFCTMLADEGIDLLTVHARLRRELCPAAALGMDCPGEGVGDHPGGGGIDPLVSARACSQTSGADGLMIGRRAAVAPLGVRRDRPRPLRR